MKAYIHIGHGKTGTSAIQSFLAKNRSILLDYGVDYPEHDSFELAKRGKVSSGNGGLLFEGFTFSNHQTSYLFSNEGLYGRLSDKNELIKFIKQIPVKPTIICYTRDLFDYYISDWGQSIKRGKGTEDVNIYAQRFQGFYRILADYIRWADEVGYELVVKNYSRHSDRLINNFCSLILKEDSSFFNSTSFDVGVVNRSLTKSEYKLQRLFNEHYSQQSSNFISDSLVNELPFVQKEQVSITEATRDLLLKNTVEDIEFINSKIEPSEHISTQFKGVIEEVEPSSDQKQYSFSSDQLNVLARSISNKIEQVSAESVKLRQENAWALRDIALKYENSEALNPEDALTLMEVAVSLYDTGPFMNRKLEEFRAALRNKKIKGLS